MAPRRGRPSQHTLVQPSMPGASSHGHLSTLMFCASSLAVVSGVYSQRGNMGQRVLAAALSSNSSSCCPGKILNSIPG